MSRGFDPAASDVSAFPGEDLASAAARQGLGLTVEDMALVQDDVAAGRLVILLDDRESLPAYFVVTPPGPMRPGSADFSALAVAAGISRQIASSSGDFPAFSAASNQRGLRPRPDQVSDLVCGIGIFRRRRSALAGQPSRQSVQRGKIQAHGLCLRARTSASFFLRSSKVAMAFATWDCRSFSSFSERVFKFTSIRCPS